MISHEQVTISTYIVSFEGLILFLEFDQKKPFFQSLLVSKVNTWVISKRQDVIVSKQ